MVYTSGGLMISWCYKKKWSMQIRVLLVCTHKILELIDAIFAIAVGFCCICVLSTCYITMLLLLIGHNVANHHRLVVIFFPPLSITVTLHLVIAITVNHLCPRHRPSTPHNNACDLQLAFSLEMVEG
ncbi:hypothetical protein U1Q18_013890 [Sarracenia purpurea var. burkii]